VYNLEQVLVLLAESQIGLGQWGEHELFLIQTRRRG
jgi:hypothetical protein